MYLVPANSFCISVCPPLSIVLSASPCKPPFPLSLQTLRLPLLPPSPGLFHRRVKAKLLISSAFLAVSSMEDLGGVAGVSLPREGPCPRSRHFGGVAEGKYRVSEGYVSVDDDVACLGPIMLDATEDCGDAISFEFSSFTLMDSDSDAARSSSSVEDPRDGQRSEKGSPHMPEGSVFNPFDADECDASQAHLLKKILDELNDCVARCINFVRPVIDIDKEGTQATDEDILDSVNRDLLEVIVAQQANEILAGISRSRMDLCSCLTPTRFPLLNGIADSCPGTPVKCPPKSRVIKWSLRRKLDF